MKKILAILTVILLMSASVIAQDMCVGDFDYDGDCDGTDASRFKQDFGRSLLKNPCPPPNPAPAPVSKTGVTISYATGDDGDLKKGVPWPQPRFTDNDDGTVTDNLTGLIWLKDANCIATNYPGFDDNGRVMWQQALDFVAGINAGTYPDCGVGSTDWRLPNINELASLAHKEYLDPAVPNTAGTGQWSEGDPFTNVQSEVYWSSTTGDSGMYGWFVNMFNAVAFGEYVTSSEYVWPVRGGR
jgi:hypothetical protein